MGENIITDLIVLLVSSGFIWYLNKIKKGVTGLEIKVDKLSTKVDELDNTVKDHTLTITEITLLDNVQKRIEIKVKQALDYVDIENDDKLIAAFILSIGNYAKECIEWGIHNKLKVTENEIIAKYESCNINVRDIILQTESDFSNRIRPALIEIVKHHVERVIQIANDELFNSKLDRFFTLTEQTTNEVITTVVRARLQWKMDNTKDPRMI